MELKMKTTLQEIKGSRKHLKKTGKNRKKEKEF